MSHSPKNKLISYGSTTMGERGQVVIPKKMRQELKINSGDKFFVFSGRNRVIILLKAEHFDSIINELTKALKNLKKIKK